MLSSALRKTEWTISLLTILLSVIHCFSNTLPSFLKQATSSESNYSQLASGATRSSLVATRPINYAWPPLTPILYSLPHMAYTFSKHISISVLTFVLIIAASLIISLINYQLTNYFCVVVISFHHNLNSQLLPNSPTQTLFEHIRSTFVYRPLVFLFNGK